ncbi:MAG: site-2 protease family protein [Myxococcota bacterium]
MLHFKVARIPVDVHFSHVAISLLLAFSFAQAIGPVYPLDAFLHGGRGAHHGMSHGLTVLLWLPMVTLSVLIHELGHASTARLFGYPATIQLFGLGGRTTAQGVERMPWHQDILFTLAGPTGGLALAVVSGLAALGLGALGHPLRSARYVLEGLVFVNIFWTFVNLFPLASLDGGRIASAVMTRVLGRPGFLWAQLFSLALCGLLLVWAVVKGQAYMALLFGLLSVRSVVNVIGYQKGELPLGEAEHPVATALKRAEALFHEGRLSEAELLAKDALAESTPVGLRSRAHFLLGWVALKEGQGRRALDHFAQVQGLDVPPEALAAGFSLIGDEARAIPLWARAAQGGDVTVLHEYAGALLRAGRDAEARRLPGLRPALAYLAAERVHAVRREFDKAAVMAEAAFREEPGPTLAYNAACDWAQAGNPDAAMRMLTLAAQNGFDDRAHAQADGDLSSLRGTPEFLAWLEALPATPRPKTEPTRTSESEPMTKA